MALRAARDAQQRSIARDHEVGAGEPVSAGRLRLALGHRRRVHEHRGERRCIALQLRRPIRQQRRRRDQEAGGAASQHRLAAGPPAPRPLASPVFLRISSTPGPGSSYRGPCHRPGRRPARGWRAGAAIARRPPDRERNVALRAAPGSSCASWAGSRRPARVFVSHGPATTDDQSGAAAATLSPDTCAPARRRIASPKDRPSFAAAVSTVRNPSSIRPSLSRSTSTQRPRTRCRPFDARAVGQSPPWSAAPVKADVHLEVEQRIVPSPDGGLPPTVAVTCGRDGRLARQAFGTRTMTPAASRRGTSVSS